jgi:GT2 family glycosyltransferase
LVDIDTLRGLPGIRMYLNRKKRMNTTKAAINSDGIILHGSAMFFTPLFFRYFKGLYTGTFLYYEENILAVLLRNNRLRVTYTADTEVYHKEDMSSTQSFGNKNRVKSGYQRSSVLKCLGLKLFRTKRI